MKKVPSPRLMRSKQQVKQWIFPATCVLSLSSWLLLEAARVNAQNPATPPPTLASAAGSVRPGAIPHYLNVLILAVDDLTLPRPAPVRQPIIKATPPLTTPSPVAPVAPPDLSSPQPAEGPAAPDAVLPPAPDDVAPAPVQPDAQPGGQPEKKVLPPIDQVEPPAQVEAPAITPAAAGHTVTQPIYQAHAKKRKKPDPNDKIFTLEPLDDIKIPKKTPQPNDPAAVPPGSAAPAASAIPPASATSPVVPLPLPGMAPQPAAPTELMSGRPAGPAGLAALPLRKALAANGVVDVRDSALDGGLVQQLIASRRLSPRVVENVQKATAQTVAHLLSTPAPSPVNTEASAQGAANVTAETLPAVIKAATNVGLAAGYRTVVVLAVAPHAAIPTPETTTNVATYTMVVVDTARETGNIIAFDEAGATDLARHDAAAGTGAALLQRELQTWPEVTPGERAAQIARHMEAAHAFLDIGDVETAYSELSMVLGLDPNSTSALIMMGDMLRESDPAGAADIYQRAADLYVLDVANGQLLEKLALSYVEGQGPNWAPLTLKAAQRAIDVKHETAAIRVAMATAQFDRAERFRTHNPPHFQQAEAAERDARKHIERALELEPANRAITTRANRLMAKHLIEQKRYKEAAEALDLLARELPDDVAIQQQYATALTSEGRRMEDAFMAWGRVWKLKKVGEAPQSAPDYKRLAGGFDQLVVNIARVAAQLTDGVARGTLPRETALLRMERLQNDMEEASDAIKTMRPPAGRTSSDVYLARVFAGDVMQQALEFYGIYLETGQDINRLRGRDLHAQAIHRLNAARDVRW